MSFLEAKRMGLTENIGIHSICAANDILVAGCSDFSANSDFTDTGCIFVYNLITRTWAGPMVPPTQKNQFSGKSVACSDDGNIIIVAAHWYDDYKIKDTGCIYIYDRKTETWTEPLVPPVQEYQFAGHSIACSRDGNVIVVGAPWYSQNNAVNTGCIYIYDRTANTWSQPIVPPTRVGQLAGFSIACSSDGNTIIVGAPYYSYNDKRNTGCIYIYERVTNTWTGPIIPPARTWQFGGKSIACSDDCSIIVVGAPEFSLDNVSVGCVYIYNRENSMWSDPVTIPSLKSEGLGMSVACSPDGKRVVIGTKSGENIYIYSVLSNFLETVHVSACGEISVAYSERHGIFAAVNMYDCFEIKLKYPAKL